LQFADDAGANCYFYVMHQPNGAPTLASIGPLADVPMRLQPKGNSDVVIVNSTLNADSVISAWNLHPTVNAFSALNLKGTEVKANGAPIVTTTNTVSMSNKTLVSPTITGNPVVNGAKLGGRVAVPTTATTAAKPGDWAADATFIYAYTGDGTTHTWVRSAAAAW
jgi:hypothetical protein